MGKETKQTLLQRRHTDGQKDGQKTFEKCSGSLIIRDAN